MANYNLTQTGAEVQSLLDTVAAGYIYMGVADLTTTPDTTNPNVCYLLKAVGTYTNFGNIQHASGIGIALWNGTAWSYQNVPSSVVTGNIQGISFNVEKYIYWGSGAMSSSTLYLSTDLIPLDGIKTINYSGLMASNSQAVVAFYDANGDFMQSISVRGTGTTLYLSGTISTSSLNASFVRFCTLKANVENASIILYTLSGIMEYTINGLNSVLTQSTQYTDGMAGASYGQTPTSADAIVKNILKNSWIEILDPTAVLPASLKMVLFRNRSTGSGNHFIVQFADSTATSTILFNGSNANKLSGVNYVKIAGFSTFANKANIYLTLDFTTETGDINTGNSGLTLVFAPSLMNKQFTTTESVKEAVGRIDGELDVKLAIKYPLGNISGVGTMGASLMYNGNNWVEDGCSLCGVPSYNKAESGVGLPSYFADKLWRGTYCTDAEFEAMDILAIQFASSGDVYTGTFLDTAADYVADFDITDTSNQFESTYTHAQCLDYILKYWQEKCYAQRNVSTSKWYGTQYGKPCRFMFVTHWHDARVEYNTSIRQIRDKWGGGICEFDKKIGFSKNQPIGTTQVSVIFAKDTTTIDGVVYGWHPLRGTDGVYIQNKMANIFADSLLEYFGQN